MWYAFNHLIKFKNEVFKPDNRVAGEADKPNMPPNDDVLHQKLVKVMAEHCRSLLMEERGITPTERIRFKNGIHQNNKGQWEIGQLPLSVACDTDHYMDHSQPTPLSVSTSDGFFFDPSYRFNTAGAWRFQVAGVFKGSIEETSVDKSDMEQAYQLTPGTASALKILHDLLILGPGGSNFKSTLLNREIDFLDLSCTVWHSTSMRRCELAWPEALCSSFWEYDLFLSAWNDALYKIEASHLLEFAVFVWLSLGTAIIDRIQPVQASNSSIFQYADLNGIIERLAGLPGNSQIPAVHAKEWLIRVFLLMMPECALPDAICAPFLQSDKLRLHWNAYLPSIVRKRAKRLGLFAQNDMPNLAAAFIDKTPPAFNEFNPAYDQIG